MAGGAGEALPERPAGSPRAGGHGRSPAPEQLPTPRTVLDAAWELARDGPLDAVTIAAVTARSGMSNGSFYHHFGGRSGLVEALYGEVIAACLAEVSAALDARPAAQVVPDLAIRYLDWVAAQPGPARVLYAVDGGRLVATAPAVQEAKAAAFGPVLAWFADRETRGEVRRWPSWGLDAIVMAPAHECARRYLATLDEALFPMMRAAVGAAAWTLARPPGPLDPTPADHL